MKRLVLGLVIVSAVLLLAPPLLAQQQEGTNERYPADVLERYWECRERTDLTEIQRLLDQHRSGRRIDATIYGLPKDDFDDRALLTIEERLFVRQDKLRNGVKLPVSGPLQYPHQTREVLDHYYILTGQRPDCSRILTDAGLPTEEPEVLQNGWTSDLNLTSADAVERGEVDVAVDVNNPARITISSCPSGSSPDSSSNYITASSDWGATWSRKAVGNNSGSTWECDPVSYYQRSTGRVYHAKIGCNTGSCGQTYVMMRYSADNGNTWADCGRPGAQTAEDREWYVIDNTASSACYGNIYATWHNSNQEYVARSTNSCAAWVNRTNLTATSQAITPDIGVAADGHVYVVWQNFGDSTFKIAGSSDCGATWASPAAKTLKSRLGDWSNMLPAQCQRGVPTQPNVDVDRCTWSAYYGRIYVVLQDFNAACTTQAAYSCSTWDTNYTNTCNFDFYLMYSNDNGATWSTPVNITSGQGNTVDNFLGYMRVDEKDGSIYLAYHRSKLSPASAADRQKTQFMVMRSTNGGSTWEGPLQVSTQEGNERSSGASSFERGDYQGFAVYDGVVWPVWVDRRGGSAEEEIVTRKVCTEPAHKSERAPNFTTAVTTATPGSSKQINVSWTLPDASWGDAGQSTSSRKFQLYVDGALAQDNISATATSTVYTASDCTTSHTFRMRAVNSCGVAKDYTQVSATATGCSACNPTVNVTPDGPLNLCAGTAQTLSVTVTGGTSPFTYQWTRDGATISGATGTTYSANDTGTHTYNCAVTGTGTGCTAVTDPSSVSITWQSAPTFAGLQTVTAPASSTCTLNLAWSAGSACSGGLTYNVYRSTTSGFTPGTSNRIATGVTATSYSDTTGLVSGTTYYYVVRAVSTATGVEETNTVQKSGSPQGPVTTGTWLDNFESGATGWTHNAASGTDDWTLSTAASHSTTHSWASVDVATVSDKRLVAPAKGLASNSVLTFWHQYTFESTYDGGVIEISTDSGSTWTDLGSAITAGGYGSTISSSYSNPLAGRSAWSGTLSTWTQVSVNLASYAGTNRLIRWRMGTDTSQAGGTWYVDDVQITNTQTYGACGGGGCTTPTFAGLTSATDVNGCVATGIALAWSAPSNWGDSGVGTRTFNILRGGSAIASVSEATLSYTDTAAPEGVASTYSVQAVNGCGSSSDGGVTRTATNADTMPAPTFAGLSTATPGASCSLVLSWSAGTPACGSGIRYNVYRSTTSGFVPGASNRIATGLTTTTYTNGPLAAGTYYYVVRAEDMTTGNPGPSGGVEETNTVQKSGTVTSGGGGSTVTLFSDTFESGTGLNGWRAGYFSGSAVDWRGIQTCSAHGGSKIFRYGNTSCTTAYSNSKFAYVNPGGTAGLVFPAGITTARLSFWHHWAFESGYDGGTLLISKDGSNFTPIPASAIISGTTYNGTTSTYCPPSTGGSRSVFTGTQSTFVNTVVDVDAAANAISGNTGGAAGKTIWIAFGAITDCSSTSTGWFLDDVQVTYVTAGACTGAYLDGGTGEDLTLTGEVVDQQ